MSSCHFKCLTSLKILLLYLKDITTSTSTSLTIIFAYINYDDKVCCKLKCSFMIVNYDHSTFTLQTLGTCYVNLFRAVIYGFL